MRNFKHALATLGLCTLLPAIPFIARYIYWNCEAEWATFQGGILFEFAALIFIILTSTCLLGTVLHWIDGK
jgi:hypothetical protein